MKAPPAPYIEIEGAWKMTKMENVEATDVFVIVYLSYMVFILKLMFYKGMYNARECMPSLSPPHHLEKAPDMTYTMHYLLLSSLTINVK
jgi:hypothetical protein